MRKYIVIALIAIVAWFFIPGVHAACLIVGITPASERRDGTPLLLSEIHSHRVYYSKNSGSSVYLKTIDFPYPQTAILLPESVNNTRFVVTTIDTGDRESDFSIEVVKNYIEPTNKYQCFRRAVSCIVDNGIQRKDCSSMMQCCLRSFS